DITETHVLWEQRKHLPMVASPLAYQGHLFLVKDGGLLTTLDVRNGQPVKQDRLPASAADCYSSPVGGDGKVYVLAQRGQLTVITAAGHGQVLHQPHFGEEASATPALAGGRIYLRTAGHLYCFGTRR